MTVRTNDLADGSVMQSYLGTFFSSFYDDNEDVEAYLDASQTARQQIASDVILLQEESSRFRCPLVRQRLYHRIRLYEDEKALRSRRPLRYGDNAMYGSNVVYGEDVVVKSFVEVPFNVSFIPTCVDHPTHPKVTLYSGVDYVMDGNMIMFATEVFDDPRWLSGARWQSDGRKYVDVWLLGALEKSDAMTGIYGPVTFLGNTDSVYGKEAINAFWDSYVYGSSQASIMRAVCGVLGIPCTAERETVLSIGHENGKLWIETTRKVYFASDNSTLACVVGDVLAAGTPLTTAISLVTVNSDVEGISLPSGVSSYGSLYFENTDTERFWKDGQLRFPIDGPADAVEAFWLQFYSSGYENAVSLLDAYTGVGGVINPFKFLTDGFLSRNYLIFDVDFGQLDADSPGMSQLSAIRFLLPPGKALLFLQTLSLGVGVLEIPGNAASSLRFVEVGEFVVEGEALTWDVGDSYRIPVMQDKGWDDDAT